MTVTIADIKGAYQQSSAPANLLEYFNIAASQHYSLKLLSGFKLKFVLEI